MKNDLIELKENSIFDKAKLFFKKIFFKKTKEQIENINVIEKNISENSIDSNTKEEKTIDFCQGIDRDMLDLQKRFHSGEIKTDELSSEQIRELIKIYNKQNKQLETTNELKKQKLLKHREKMWQSQNKEILTLQKKFHFGEMKAYELSSDQVKELIKLYNKQNKELEKANELKKQELLKYRKNMVKKALV